MFSTIKRFINYIRWLYMQYLLNTALYMLEPPEIKLFNFIILVVFVTAAYSTYIFLPSQMFRFFDWITHINDSA
ncbi:serine palmitoyltransferase small subunit B, partial [Brachionus plicatilis]